MILSTPADSNLSLNLIEACLTFLGVALAFAIPGCGSRVLRHVEAVFGRLARKRGLAVVSVGVAALVLRLAILPFCPVPLPFDPNDFSFLLAGDTFAHGRLTNPTPAMWMHFESIHITMLPSYASMYFPSTGLVLAAGKVLLGHPWYGLLLTSALMCAAICWMLQAWLPPTWALLGGVLAILRIGLFSYWINTYSGGGSISALGGALVLGSLPRLMKTAQARYGLLMAVGIVLLATTRPYEGLLLCLPVAIVLGRWILFGKNRPRPGILLRRAALPLVVILVAGLWMSYYDSRAFGSPTTLPYTVDRATYAVAPYFVWQKPRPVPVYRHKALHDFYAVGEFSDYLKIHSFAGFVPQTLRKFGTSLLFFAGFALLPPLIMVRRVLLDKRIRFLVLSVLTLCLGMMVQVYLVPHYLAPFTTAFYAIGLQAMRHLRVWRPEGKAVGVTLVRLTVGLCIALAGVRLFAQPLHLRFAEWPSGEWIIEWYGPGHFGTERAGIESSLQQLGGKHLVIVRYAANHNPMNEWVYNDADIDDAKVIWAREMDTRNNMELIRYYKDRKVWLAEPDTKPVELSAYPVAVSPESPVVEQH